MNRAIARKTAKLVFHQPLVAFEQVDNGCYDNVSVSAGSPFSKKAIFMKLWHLVYNRLLIACEKFDVYCFTFAEVIPNYHLVFILRHSVTAEIGVLKEFGNLCGLGKRLSLYDLADKFPAIGENMQETSGVCFS